MMKHRLSHKINQQKEECIKEAKRIRDPFIYTQKSHKNNSNSSFILSAFTFSF